MDLETFYRRHQTGHAQRIVVASVYGAVSIAYFTWRLSVFNPDAIAFSVLFYAAELLAFVGSIITFFICWRVVLRKPAAPPAGLTVDVWIPTYNESIALVRRTVMAAMRIEYPHQTWLLDDGNRPEMRELALTLGCRYLAREKNTDAKPGNLNNALPHSEAEFIAILDSDHVAQKNMLHALLGYFGDPQVAFVQAPQDYYNISAFQYRNKKSRQMLWNDQAVFFNIRMAGRDFWNAATCCGTGVVFRRSAIDRIGGFPPQTVTEDMHTAIRLQKIGYKSVYHPMPVAYGVAPTDFGEYQRQRLRWGQGNVQVCREERIPFTRGLTWAQRICYFELGFLYLEGWTRLLFYLTPPIVLLTGISPIGYTEALFWFLLPYLAATYLYFEEMSRGSLRLPVNEQLVMARFPVYIASTFGLFLNRIRWRVSSKEFVGHLQVYLLLPQIAVLILNLAAMAVTVFAPPARLVESLSPGVIGFVMLWAAVYILLALQVIREAVRCARNKRRDYRFEVPLPLRIVRPSTKPVTAVVDDISEDGMTLSGSFLSGVEAGEALEGTLYLPGGSLPFRAQVVDLRRAAARGLPSTADCRFEWASIADRDRLDRNLHSCAWHRQFCFAGDYFRTPLDILSDLFSGAERSARQRPGWEPALCHAPGGGDEARFCVVAADPARGGSARLLSFQPLPAGSRLNVQFLVRAAAGAMASFEIRGDAMRTDLSSGLDDIQVHEYQLQTLAVERTAASFTALPAAPERSLADRPGAGSGRRSSEWGLQCRNSGKRSTPRCTGSNAGVRDNRH